MIDRRAMLRRAACWSAALALPFSVAAGPRGAWAGPAAKTGAAEKSGEPKGGEEKGSGKSVPLEFMDSVDSRTARKGDVIPLKVVDDVTLEDGRQFRKDAEASAIIESVSKPGRFGKRAQIKMRLDWVKDADGERVPLGTYDTGHRFAPGAGGASLGAAVFLGPIGLLGGAFVKGGHLVIKKGTRIQAKLLEAKPK
jgi:hypothetical protein